MARMEQYGGSTSGFEPKQALDRYSDERGVIFKTGAWSNDSSFEDVGSRVNGDGSRVYVARLLRTPPMNRDGSWNDADRCADLAALSDRIQVSACVYKASGPGYVDLEIRARHGRSATSLFRAQFDCGSGAGRNEPQWLLTLSGFVATEWEIHVSFVPFADPDVFPAELTAQVEIYASVDRAGCGAPGDGTFNATWNEALVTNNTFAPIVPVLSREYAASGSLSAAAYNAAVPNWVFPFIPDGVSFALNDPASTDPLWISFDGINDHVFMVPGTPTAAFSMPTSRFRFWARSPSGNAVSVQILASRGGGV